MPSTQNARFFDSDTESIPLAGGYCNMVTSVWIVLKNSGHLVRFWSSTLALILTPSLCLPTVYRSSYWAIILLRIFLFGNEVSSMDVL